MDFTREPIIETIITPKEGHKLVVRSSKNAGQEEYFVDAVEVVAFGQALFFRSMERPKAFLAPVSDYEVLEVREARMVLKNAGLDRSIKIGGGKDAHSKASHRDEVKEEALPIDASEGEEESSSAEPSGEGRPEVRADKKRDRRRSYRKRRGKDESGKEGGDNAALSPAEDEAAAMSEEEEEIAEPTTTITPAQLSALLEPPPMLISETINRYRQDDMFKEAFYMTEEEQYKPHDKVQDLLNEDEELDSRLLEEPTFDSDASDAVSDLHELVESEENGDQEVSAESVEVEEKNEPQISLPIYAQEEDLSMEGVYFHLPSPGESEVAADPAPSNQAESDPEKS